LQTKLKILVVICFVISPNYLRGQDIHFSQYFNSPLSLNPSQTGNFDGDWRAFVNYRNQWQAIAYPFRTVSVGYDQQLFVNGNHLSIGGYVLNDQSGSVFLKLNQAYLSAAYHRVINNHHFTGGLQIGYVIKSINYDKITFPNDWTGTNFDPEHAVDENDRNQLSYLDINLGIGWKSKINKFEPEAGLAVFHVNQPSESFSGSTSYKVPLRTTFHVAVKTDLSSNFYLKPGVLYSMARGSREMMVGSQLGYAVAGNRFNVREIYGGLYLRNGIADPSDAVMVMCGAQIKKITINVSYDLTLSSLKVYNGYRGAFELSIIFKSITTIIKTFTLPCERI
jgi:type IX secretion system PorP/SprF family membrane protein